MSTLLSLSVFVLPAICLAFAIYMAVRTMKITGNAKRAFSKHLITLAISVIICMSCVAFCSAADSKAEEKPTQPAQSQSEEVKSEDSGAGLAAGLGFIGAGLSIGLAGLGAGIALASGTPAAIGAVAEDPKSFGKSIIFVALGEAVAIYGFIIAFLIILRLPSAISL